MTSLPVIKTFINSLYFLGDNFSVALQVIRPVLPLLLGLSALYSLLYLYADFLPPLVAAVVNILVVLMALVVTAGLMIAWHRAYIQGPDSAGSFDLYRPTRQDKEFIGKLFLALLVFVVLVVAYSTASAALSSFLMVLFVDNPLGLFVDIVMLALIVAGAVCITCLAVRVALYFPAKATGNYLSFTQSFYLAKGCGWRLLAMQVLVQILASIIVMVYALVTPYALTTDSTVTEPPPIFSFETLSTVLWDIPAFFILYVFGLFIAVSNISQAYIWIIREKGSDRAIVTPDPL